MIKSIRKLTRFKYAVTLVGALELGGPHGEVPAGRVLFRAASRRTGLARFRASGSPVITPWRRLVSGWRRGRVGRPRGSCAVFWP